jgi:DNA repair photolyase
MGKKHVSGTGEWAAHSVNIQRGCSSNCLYCYAKANSIRFGKSTPENWGTPTIDEDAVTRKYSKKNGTIMFPTAHDISPDNIMPSIKVLLAMLKVGNKVLIVSKPHLSCVAELCAALGAYKGQILFRFTIGLTSDEVLSFWEPNAPKFAERLACLALAYKAGYATSVSCEPMLDDQVNFVVASVMDFVTDAIWLGKPNKLMLRAGMNTKDEAQAAVMATALLDKFDDKYIHCLYKHYCDDPIIKWKDSIKQIVGLERSTIKGLDA